jgi:hypothetical protein
MVIMSRYIIEFSNEFIALKIYKVILHYNTTIMVTVTLSEELYQLHVDMGFAYNGWGWNPEQEEVISYKMTSSSGVSG